MQYWNEIRNQTYTYKQPAIFLEDILLGVIILRPTGVFYGNQTGGTSNMLPQAERAFVPLPAPKIIERWIADHFTLEKWGGRCNSGIDSETADYLDNILSLHYALQFITVDRDSLEDCHEAWIYVNLVEPKGDPQMRQIAGFGSCRGILTWNNSD